MTPNKLLYSAMLISLQCIVCTTLFAQTTPPPKQWDKRFGGSTLDAINSLQQTTDGGYILGGFSYSGIGGDKTEDSRGGEDYWIVKIDANGIKQWDKRFGGSSFDELTSLQQTTDGGYILGGYSGSGISGDKTEVSRGINTSDYWIVKVDASGIKQWDKCFGGTDYDVLNSLQQTTDGGYILGGYSKSGIGGDKTEDNRGPSYTNDYWVVKVDANGVKQWDKRFGGTEDDYFFSLQQTTDGGYILGGESISGIGGDKTEGWRGANDYWIVKIDANGSKQWDKRFGGSNEDHLRSLQQTTDSGYILGGYSGSGISGDKTEDSRGNLDYWMIKIDATGIKQWDKRFGGTLDDYFNSLQQTTDGGYILGGYSYSGIGGDKTQTNRGIGDFWVVKTDARGVKQWDKRFGGTGVEEFKSLQQTTDGGYILGGHSFSGMGGDKTQGNRGAKDYWVVKLGCPPSAKVGHINSLEICTTGSVQLIADESSDVKFQWLKDGVKIVGATKRAYTATTPGMYRVVVYTSRECSQVSKVLTVTNSCDKIADNTSISGDNLSVSTNEISIYPNPSKGNISVTYKSLTSGEMQLNIFDITGKKFFTKTVQAIAGSNQYQLNVSGLAAGIYILQINNNNAHQQVKLVIDK